MRLSTLSFLIGILICQTLSELPDSRWVLLLLPLAWLAWSFPTLKILLFLVLGFFWTVWRAEMILTQELSPILEKQEIIVVGNIVDLPHYKDQRWQFDFMPTQLIFKGEHQALPGKIRLTWETLQYSLQPGQQWQFSVQLKRPQGTLNPGGTDYSAKLFQQRIRAIGTVRKKGNNRLLADSSGFNIDLLRYRLAQTFKQQFGEHPSVGILIALTIGDGNEISQAQWEVFRHTGTTHLMVISGLHIGAVAFFAYLLASLLWRWLGPAALWLPTPYFAIFVSLIAAFFYTLFAGFSIPTQRAFIMVAVGVLSLSSGRIVISYKLALALLLVLIYDPFAVMTVGFWLSFGTVAMMIYVSSGRLNFSTPDQRLALRLPDTMAESMRMWFWYREQLLKKSLGIFIKIQMALVPYSIPVILFFYGDVFLISPLANFIAIPVVNLLILPMIFCGIAITIPFPEYGYIILNLVLNLLEGFDYSLMNILGFLANIKSNDLSFFIPPLWVTSVAIIGTTVLLLPRGFPARWLGMLGLLPLFSLPTSQLQSGEVEFTLLDVGQGLASVIRTQNHVLIYDTGRKQGDFDVGQTIILPFLRSQRIKKIDILMISHLEIDHYGGSFTLLKNLPIKTVFTNFPEKAKKLKITETSQPCLSGQQWQWDGVQFEILHPPLNYSTNNNDSSCVLKISSGQHALLLSGDIGKWVEYRLVQLYPQQLSADVLIAPHHGSRYSSSEPFIEAVKPQLVLFSTGYLNHFNHPHPQTQARYQSYGVQPLQTDLTGAITLHLSEKGITNIMLAREQLRRYWHDDRPSLNGKSRLHNDSHK